MVMKPVLLLGNMRLYEIRPHRGLLFNGPPGMRFSPVVFVEFCNCFFHLQKEVMFYSVYACLSVCLSVLLSVCLSVRGVFQHQLKHPLVTALLGYHYHLYVSCT